MVNVKKILKHEAQFKALTSLQVEEFKALLSYFRHRWYQYHKHFGAFGKRRKKPLSARAYLNDTRTLNTVEDKLFFILLFFKTNSIQQHLAAEFEMDQSQVSRWIQVLLPIIHQAIVKYHCQPAQAIDELIRLFRRRQSLPGKDKAETDAQVLNLDATAHPVVQNVDRQAQKKDFSRKHYGYRLKKKVICDEFQFIHFASPTWLGSMHDKTINLEELPTMKPLEAYELWFSKDKGYQNYRPPGVHLLEPTRARLGKPLTDVEKHYNAWGNSTRVVVENVIKRLNLLARPMRYWRHNLRNQFFQIGCDLHNLPVRFRMHNYARESRFSAYINSKA